MGPLLNDHGKKNIHRAEAKNVRTNFSEVEPTFLGKIKVVLIYCFRTKNHFTLPLVLYFIFKQNICRSVLLGDEHKKTLKGKFNPIHEK